MLSLRWILALLLFFQVWYRAHTFGPTIKMATGLNLWPATIGQTEPLDCDEAAYAYIGKRLISGDVIYRDVSENKPPLGYWLYAACVALGGYRELAVRLLPLPFVLGATACVWTVVRRLAGRAGAVIATVVLILSSTDPYLFGNGANMEHFMNAFATAMLAFLVVERTEPSRWLLAASGVGLAGAVLVKQVAMVQLVPAACFLILAARQQVPGQGMLDRWIDLAALLVGLASTLGLAALALWLQGAGASAVEDIFRYGRALATDLLPDPHAPSPLDHWLTGNADPRGELPPPFGHTSYLVWWGSGSWPLFLASAPCLIWLLCGRGQSALRRLVAGFTLFAWVEVILPGLYWPHYYLLITPGLAITIGIALGDALAAIQSSPRKLRLMPMLAALGLSAAIAGETWLQVWDYLLVAPEELTIRYKGGRQWVVLRALGLELKERTRGWDQPRLYIWGWQSPLHFYSGLDSPTRHFFVDNLLRDQADRGHPLIEPRTREIAATLRRDRPILIFTGYPPFRELAAILKQDYRASSLAPGLWVLQAAFRRFERATERTNQAARAPRNAAGNTVKPP